MRRMILFAASMMVCTLASSQELTLAELKTKNATQLTAAELRELLPGAKVVEQTDGGSTHRWQNKPDGTFIASTDGRGKQRRAEFVRDRRGHVAGYRGCQALHHGQVADQPGRLVPICLQSRRQVLCRHPSTRHGAGEADGDLQVAVPLYYRHRTVL